MNTSHAKAIKGMSIANIVLGALGLAGTLIVWMVLGAGGSYVANSGYDYFYTDDGYVINTSDINMILGLIGFFVFWVLICFVIVLVAGIIGVRGAAKPDKLKGVMVWNIVGAVASFLGAGIVSLVLCIVVAVFANKDKKAFEATPYAAPVYAAPQQPGAAAAAAAVPVAAAVAAEAVAGAAMPATAATAPAEVVATEQVVAAEPLTSDPAPVAPTTAEAAAEAAAEPAILLPDNYIEDAQAAVTIVEEAPTAEDDAKDADDDKPVA